MNLFGPNIKIFSAAICFAVALLGACGSPEVTDSGSEDERGVVRVSGGGGGGGDSRIEIPIKMQTTSSSSSAFGLVSTPSFIIELNGCISGYTATTSDVVPSLKVYNFDRGCKAMLTEVVINGHTLIPTSYDPFTTWDAGDLAIFDEVGEAGIYAVEIVVVSQLSNPVTGVDTIEYQIREVLTAVDQSALVPPISISAGPCCTTNALKANGVELTLNWSPLTSRYNQVTVRRKAGAVAPAAVDCSSDTLVTTYASFTSGGTVLYTDDTLNAGQIFSYRACVFDVGAQVIETATVSNVTSANIQWMFSTSSIYPSGGFGMAAATSTCQTLGDSIDSTLEWDAIMSDSSREAPGRMPISGTIYNTNSTPQVVATSYGQFWGGPLTNAGRYTESGGADTGAAWTGTTLVGNRSANNCNNWTDSTSGFIGTRGTVNSTTLYMEAGTTNCSIATRGSFCMSKAVRPLSAFSAALPGSGADGDVAITVGFPGNTTGWTKIDIRRSFGAAEPDDTCTVAPLVKTYSGPTFIGETFTDATGKPGAYYRYVACLYSGANLVSKLTTFSAARARSVTPAHTVFLTSTTYKGNHGGITGSDALCQAAGNKISTGKTWLAVVSTSTVNANSGGRIVATTGIRNINGDLVANNSAAFFGGTLALPVKYDELGTDAGAALIWTGSTAAGAGAANHCTNFTNQNTSRQSTYGIANATNSTWLDSGSTQACNTFKSIYCFSTTPD